MNELYKERLTTDDYSYRRVLEMGGSKELADKYLAYENAGVDKVNALWNKVTTHKTMGELFDLINEKTGLNLHYNFTIKNNYQGKPYVSYESVENLVDNNPILALAWKEMKVSNFNGGHISSEEYGTHKENSHYSFYEADEIDYDKPITCKFYIDIHYSYSHIDGGTNGAKVGYANYDGEKWVVELDKDEKRY